MAVRPAHAEAGRSQRKTARVGAMRPPTSCPRKRVGKIRPRRFRAKNVHLCVFKAESPVKANPLLNKELS